MIEKGIYARRKEERNFFIMKSEQSLVEGNVIRVLLTFAVPFLVANLLQAFYGAVDLFVVGQFGDSAQVSAVATGSQVMQTVTGMISGLTMGGTVFIGQLIGAKKENHAANAIGSMICLFGVLGVCISAVLLLFTPYIVSVMNVPVQAIIPARSYLFICSSGVFFITGYNMVSGILRGMGDSKYPMIFVAIACVVNIALDILFVAVFQMGAAGAALATIIAQASSLALAVFMIKKRGFTIPVSKENICLRKSEAKKILFFGAPIALQDGLVNVSFLIITAIVNGMGVTASASLGVVERLIGFAMLPPAAFMSAVAAMVAQNMGAGERGRATKCLKIGISCSLLFGILVYILSQMIPETFTAIFSKDRDVISMAGLYLKSFSIDCIMVAFVFCFNGFFSGCGKTIFTMTHSLIATFLVRIPVTYFVSRMADVTMYEMGLAAPLSSLLSIIICMVYYKSSKWEK